MSSFDTRSALQRDIERGREFAERQRKKKLAPGLNPDGTIAANASNQRTPTGQAVSLQQQPDGSVARVTSPVGAVPPQTTNINSGRDITDPVNIDIARAAAVRASRQNPIAMEVGQTAADPVRAATPTGFSPDALDDLIARRNDMERSLDAGARGRNPEQNTALRSQINALTRDINSMRIAQRDAARNQAGFNTAAAAKERDQRGAELLDPANIAAARMAGQESEALERAQAQKRAQDVQAEVERFKRQGEARGLGLDPESPEFNELDRLRTPVTAESLAERGLDPVEAEIISRRGKVQGAMDSLTRQQPSEFGQRLRAVEATNTREAGIAQAGEAARDEAVRQAREAEIAQARHEQRLQQLSGAGAAGAQTPEERIVNAEAGRIEADSAAAIRAQQEAEMARRTARGSGIPEESLGVLDVRLVREAGLFGGFNQAFDELKRVAAINPPLARELALKAVTRIERGDVPTFDSGFAARGAYADQVRRLKELVASLAE